MEKPIDDIIEKIRKLHRKAESCKQMGSEEEAQAFAEAVQRMMNDYKISMSDIDFEKELKKGVEKERIRWSDHGMQTTKKRSEWIIRLAGVIARHHSCQIVSIIRSNSIIVVGHEHNRKAASYVIVVLVRLVSDIADKEYNKYYSECLALGTPSKAKGFKASFIDGFTIRVFNRLKEQQDKLRESTAGSTAIVRVGSELAAVKKFVDDNYKPGALPTGRTKDNEIAFNRGVDLANQININPKGIETSKIPKNALR